MKMKDAVRSTAGRIIVNATGLPHASDALLEELIDAGVIADEFETVKQARKAGMKSGMLRNGDTFGSEDTPHE